MYPGEYSNPLPRKTFVNCPVVSGYVASRLHDQSYFAPAISGTPETMLVTYENVGGTAFTVQLRETADRSVSGTRYTLGTPVYLVPAGQDTRTYQCKQPYLEVLCTGTTTGQLRMQIDSQRKWDQMGFSKDDPFYAPQLFQAKAVPGPIS